MIIYIFPSGKRSDRYAYSNKSISAYSIKTYCILLFVKPMLAFYKERFFIVHLTIEHTCIACVQPKFFQVLHLSQI